MLLILIYIYIYTNFKNKKLKKFENKLKKY